MLIVFSRSHPGDRRYLGVCWEGQVFIDHCLPFGLSSAPKIATAFADALAWIYSLRCCDKGRPSVVAQVWHFVISQNATVVHVNSDASGNFGCGAVTGDARWL